MDEPNVLVADDLDLVDEAEALQVVAQQLLRQPLVEATQVHVAAGIALLDRERHLLRHRAGLAPTNLELLAMKRKLLDCGVGVEEASSLLVQEGEEDAGLVGEDADRLEGPEVDKVEELVNGSVVWEVANVDGALDRLVSAAGEGR